jgi:hypothetical protein
MTTTYILDENGKCYAEMDDLDPKTARIAIPPGHCVITDERFVSMTGFGKVEIPVTKTPMEALGCTKMTAEVEIIEEKPIENIKP